MAVEGTPESLIEFIAKGIVDNPDDVRVSVRDGVHIELETNPDDRGRVIGRQGRVAKAAHYKQIHRQVNALPLEPRHPVSGS